MTSSLKPYLLGKMKKSNKFVCINVIIMMLTNFPAMYLTEKRLGGEKFGNFDESSVIRQTKLSKLTLIYSIFHIQMLKHFPHQTFPVFGMPSQTVAK